MTGETAARPMDDVPTRTNASTLTRRHRDAREVSVDRDRAGDMRAVCVAPSRVEGDARETSGARGTGVERWWVDRRPWSGTRARAREVSEEDGDEDDSGTRRGRAASRDAHGKYTFSIKKTEPAKKLPRRREPRGAREAMEDDAVKRKTVRELLLSRDPGLNQTLISSGTSISQLFDQDKWERHRMVDRFITRGSASRFLRARCFCDC